MTTNRPLISSFLTDEAINLFLFKKDGTVERIESRRREKYCGERDRFSDDVLLVARLKVNGSISWCYVSDDVALHRVTLKVEIVTQSDEMLALVADAFEELLPDPPRCADLRAGDPAVEEVVDGRPCLRWRTDGIDGGTFRCFREFIG